MPQYIEIISKIKPKNQQSFKVADLTDIQVNFSADSNVLYVQGDTLATSGITWQNTESFCNIDGDLHINGSLFQNSDISLKKNVIKIPNAIQTLKSVDGVSFQWKQNDKKDYGVIAQQLETILPQMVSYNNKTGLRQVSYIKLIPFLIQAVKQLSQRVDLIQNNKSNNTFLKRLIVMIKSLWEKIM